MEGFQDTLLKETKKPPRQGIEQSIWYDPICAFKKLCIHIQIRAYLCKKFMERYTFRDRDGKEGSVELYL